jgi:hypothetical protein
LLGIAAGGGAGVMEQFYKNHNIEVSVWLNGEGWFINVFIYYREEATNILVTFAVKEKFTTYDEAVEAGLNAARRWIDGKTEP